MSGFLLRGGCVLGLGPKAPNFPEADVLVEGDRIVEIGSKLRVSRGIEVVDASGTILMPGFVDAHRHLWESLFCNLGDHPALSGSSAASVYGPHHDADDVYAATYLGLLRALDGGVTTTVDFYDGPPEHIGAAVAAHADAGLRTVIVPAPSPWSDHQAPAVESSDLMSVAYGSPDPQVSTLDQIGTIWSQARSSGHRIHAHVGRTPGEAGVVVALLDRGLLGADLTMIHLTHSSDADLDAVSGSGAGVVLTPSAEMAGGLGMPPLQAMLDRDIKPGLGVDTERVAPSDIFAQMRAVISLQHADHFDRKLAGKGGLPRLMTTREAIRYATTDGARVAGLGSVTGSLEPGRQADILMLRADLPNIAPINDPIGAVVWGMDTVNVDSVFVAGRPLKRDGSVLADTSDAISRANAAQQRVGYRCGLVTAGRPE